MKQLYCLLLVIIFLYFVYDNKLVEANDHEYDTSQDATITYDKTLGQQQGSILDELGISNLIPKDYLPKGATESNTAKLNCSEFDKLTCENGIGPHRSGHQWEYNNKTPSKDNKKKCMRCFKCKDNYAFTDEFYSHMCDTLAGCYSNPTQYIGDSLPYTFAYANTNFGRECSATDNAAQKITCGLLENNPVLDTLMLTKKLQNSACAAEIATLNSPVGRLAELF